jgi:hypothetical protein
VVFVEVASGIFGSFATQFGEISFEMMWHPVDR